ncbi:MAG TPA: Gfo/Idh/MocA family oxidoreductase [Candidatus Dormibacteraeota bacterium]|jgi:scyllo-inositol 2-dehydrogenase (NADP+)|nr:Gfo/Idh/MocA family oxidoreductase [Candidatus Dormibacteraeota bacterium]
MVRVGLIGFGLAGQAFHAPVIRGVPGMELACILERRGTRAQEKYPDVRVARALDEMLADKTIQLCVVATPNDSHFELARDCLLAGRDVVVDKPFAPTLRESAELVRLAAERGRLITVYQDRRWDGDFATLKKIVQSGRLGTVVEYEARFDRFRLEAKANAWRERADQPGAGVLFDLGPHVIDQALVLFGEPRAITASAFCQRQTSQVDDAFDVCLEYSGSGNGLRAMARARIIAYAPGPHFLIHGTKGSFVKYGMDPQEERLRGENLPQGTDWGVDWGVEDAQWQGTLTLVGEPSVKVKTERGDYRGFYANVRDAIEKKAALEVTPEQALRTMRAVMLAHKSSRERRTVAWEEAAE